MAQDFVLPTVNTNPSRFEELAGVLASAAAYLRDYDNLQ